MAESNTSPSNSLTELLERIICAKEDVEQEEQEMLCYTIIAKWLCSKRTSTQAKRKRHLAQERNAIFADHDACGSARVRWTDKETQMLWQIYSLWQAPTEHQPIDMRTWRAKNVHEGLGERFGGYARQKLGTNRSVISISKKLYKLKKAHGVPMRGHQKL